jgi:hypothetical protein
MILVTLVSGDLVVFNDFLAIPTFTYYTRQISVSSTTSRNNLVNQSNLNKSQVHDTNPFEKEVIHIFFSRNFSFAASKKIFFSHSFHPIRTSHTRCVMKQKKREIKLNGWLEDLHVQHHKTNKRKK